MTRNCTPSDQPVKQDGQGKVVRANDYALLYMPMLLADWSHEMRAVLLSTLINPYNVFLDNPINLHMP
jgi:hypothetical protein